MSSFCRPPVSSDGRKLVCLVEQFLQVHCQMSIELISLPDLLLANTFLLLFASCFYHTSFINVLMVLPVKMPTAVRV